MVSAGGDDLYSTYKRALSGGNKSKRPSPIIPSHSSLHWNKPACCITFRNVPDVCFNLCLMAISGVCSFVIMQLSFPDCGQLLPRQHLVFYVVARRSTGALQQNRNESAADGSLFISGSWSDFIWEQWSGYQNVAKSVIFYPKIKKLEVLHCDIMTFFTIFSFDYCMSNYFVLQ